MELTAVYRKVKQGYIGFVEELPGANTQATTLQECRESLVEAVALVFDSNRMLAEKALKGKKVRREAMAV